MPYIATAGNDEEWKVFSSRTKIRMGSVVKKYSTVHFPTLV